MSLSSYLKSWKFCKFTAWFCPWFFGVASIWAATQVEVTSESADIQSAIYAATGLICLSLFCLSLLLINLVEQGRKIS